jgi:pimeloyl-ACP methyl ester carboxylesterase
MPAGFHAGAKFTLEFNITGFAEYFNVIAADWLGHGQSEEIFSIENMWELHIPHIATFTCHLDIETADFRGCGTMADKCTAFLF